MRSRMPAGMDPVRDWIAVVTMSILILIGIIVWNVWAFETIAAGGTLGKTTVPPSVSFTPSSLSSVTSIFSTREEEQNKYLTGVYRFADPSQ